MARGNSGRILASRSRQSFPWRLEWRESELTTEPLRGTVLRHHPGPAEPGRLIAVDPVIRLLLRELSATLTPFSDQPSLQTSYAAYRSPSLSSPFASDDSGF